VRVCVAIAVVVVAVLVVLAVVPTPQRATYQTDLPVYGPNILGCGHSVLIAESWTFPAGKWIHLSWTTSPATNITIVASTPPTGNVSLGGGNFSESGTSGSRTFQASGGEYEFDFFNCENQATTVTISAYYNFNAPLL